MTLMGSTLPTVSGARITLRSALVRLNIQFYRGRCRRTTSAAGCCAPRPAPRRALRSKIFQCRDRQLLLGKILPALVEQMSEQFPEAQRGSRRTSKRFLTRRRGGPSPPLWTGVRSSSRRLPPLRSRAATRSYPDRSFTGCTIPSAFPIDLTMLMAEERGPTHQRGGGRGGQGKGKRGQQGRERGRPDVP